MVYICKICKKKYKSKHNYEKHLAMDKSCSIKYVCTKCSYVFQYEKDLVKHMNRKTLCAPEEIPIITDDNPENRCQFCNKTYATKSSLTRHQKTCDKEVNMKLIMNMLIDLKKDNMELKKNQNRGNASSSVVNNFVSNNNNLYLGTTPCAFGEEDYTLLDQKKVQRMFLEDAPNFVSALICEIHNNPDLPQFHNVYYETKHDKAMVFTKKIVNGITVHTWELQDFSEVSKQLVTKAKRYPTCMPLAQGIPRNSAEEARYCQSLHFVSKEYEHSEQDLINNKKMLTNVTKNPGFFKMIENTTYISNNLPLIPLN